jgi:uncharacterized membrane protein YgdD (TMEM256/DUF423 family)
MNKICGHAESQKHIWQILVLQTIVNFNIVVSPAAWISFAGISLVSGDFIAFKLLINNISLKRTMAQLYVWSCSS